MPTLHMLTRTRGERLVLNFHGIGDPPIAIPAEEEPFWCAEHRFRELLDAVTQLSQRLPVPIELTFDDGNMSDATIALPELHGRNLHATFLVCAGRLGRRGYLDEPAVRRIADSGMKVGSHGSDHIDWRLADDATLDREIDGARRALADVTGRAIDAVAIPFGRYDRRVLGRLRSSRFSQIFTSDGGRASLHGKLIPREAYETWWGDETIEQLALRRVPPRARLRRSMGRTVRRFR